MIDPVETGIAMPAKRKRKATAEPKPARRRRPKQLDLPFGADGFAAREIGGSNYAIEKHISASNDAGGGTQSSLRKEDGDTAGGRPKVRSGRRKEGRKGAATPAGPQGEVVT